MTRTARRARDGKHPRSARRRLLAGFSLALAWLAAPLSPAQEAVPAAGPGRTEPGRVHYRIDANLDGEQKKIRGELTLTWTNRSGEAVEDLWFHLYLNAFSNNRSTHMTEANGILRGHEVESGWGWSEVQEVQVATDPAGEELVDVFPTFRYRRPDDGSEDDRTVFSVDLPEPLPDGATVHCRVRWEAQLPRVRRRTGYKDDFLLVAQWFPKLGVYEAGSGWNCHQFHANSEFFSNYGTYDVTLDLPLEYKGKVKASGVVQEEDVFGRLRVEVQAPSVSDRRRTDAFGKTPLVHDFTWTGDPDFVVKKYIFDPTEWRERFPEEVEWVRGALGEDANLAMRNVDVTVLIQPEREAQARRHFEATAAALFFYGLWFGEYPYQHITVIDPAWGGRAAGGMEYPTLFTCGTQLFTEPDMYVPESVTVHECGHQFWYGLVGNNEFEAAWMDEGFNSYTDSEVLWRVYGPRRSVTQFARLPVDGVPVGSLPSDEGLESVLAARRIPLPWIEDLHPIRSSGWLDLWREQPSLTFVPEWTDPRWDDRSGYLRDPDVDPVETESWLYVDPDSYRTNSYPRPAVALRTLASLVGHDVFLKGMRHYAATWRYDHPYPADFYRTFQEGAGVDVQWYFDEVFRGTGTIDWSVEVEQHRRSEPKGFFQSEAGSFIERAEPEEEGDGEPDVQEPWSIEVVLRAKGELALPLDVRLEFADDSTRELTWTREEQLATNWKKIRLESESKLRAVLLDPDRGIYLDADLSNNRWFDQEDETASWRWGERVLARIQRQLHWISGLGG